MVTIGLLRPQDRAEWERLWSLYLTSFSRALSDDVTATTWARILDDAAAVHGLGARIDGALVGFAHVIVHPTTLAVESRCYLNDLFTHESVRGRGIGKALILETISHAKQLGCDRVYWLTHETNEAARMLYDKLAQRSGFIEYRFKLA